MAADGGRLGSTRDLGVTESLFAVGNGYLGMRGNVEEGRETHTHGTFINGFHETWKIRHAERGRSASPGSGRPSSTSPDNKTIKLYVDDEPLLLSGGRPGVRTSARSTSAPSLLRREPHLAHAGWQAGQGVLHPDGLPSPSGTWRS